MNRLEALLRSLETYSSRPCIAGLNFSYSYGDLLLELHSWSARLSELPVTADQVIGLRADYSLSSIGALLALLSRRLVPALIPRDRLRAEYTVPCHACGVLDINIDGTYAYTPVEPSAADHPLLAQLAAQGDAGFIIFTSGSTGAPKAALHSMDRFLSKFDRPGRTFRTLAFMLFDHIAGLDTVFYTLRNGGTLILTRRRDPKAVVELISSRMVEVLPTSPSFLRLLCSFRANFASDLSSLKIITYGSEPMDAATLRRVNERFPNVQVLQKYGTTEFGSPQTISRANDSLWLKFKGAASEFKVVNGMLWLRSKGTMLGYMNAPPPLTQDGWFCTGDLVEVDGDWLRFRGRADDLIKVGGEKVSPSEVERVIMDLNFIRDALVFAESHPLMGQVLAARIAVTIDCPPSKIAAIVRQHCRRHLGPHHTPVRVILTSEGSLPGYRWKSQRARATSANSATVAHTAQSSAADDAMRSTDPAS